MLVNWKAHAIAGLALLANTALLVNVHLRGVNRRFEPAELHRSEGSEPSFLGEEKSESFVPEQHICVEMRADESPSVSLLPSEHSGAAVPALEKSLDLFDKNVLQQWWPYMLGALSLDAAQPLLGWLKHELPAHIYTCGAAHEAAEPVSTQNSPTSSSTHHNLTALKGAFMNDLAAISITSAVWAFMLVVLTLSWSRKPPGTTDRTSTGAYQHVNNPNQSDAGTMYPAASFKHGDNTGLDPQQLTLAQAVDLSAAKDVPGTFRASVTRASAQVSAQMQRTAGSWRRAGGRLQRGDKAEDESNLDLGLQLSTGWVPETMAAVKRMSAQALVAHAAIQQLGQSPTERTQIESPAQSGRAAPVDIDAAHHEVTCSSLSMKKYFGLISADAGGPAKKVHGISINVDPVGWPQ